MNAFGKFASGIGFTLSAVGALRQVGKAGAAAEGIDTAEQWSAAAPGFAQAADKLVALAAKLERISAASGMGAKSSEMRERVEMGADGMKLLSVYALAAGTGEPMGDYAVALAEKIQKSWEGFRSSVLLDAQAGPGAAGGASGQMRLANMFALAVQPSLAIGARVRAKGLATKGLLGDEEHARLVADFHASSADHALVLHARDMQELAARMNKLGKGESASGMGEEAAGKMWLRHARNNVMEACELAQIHFFAGKADQALAVLRDVPKLPLQETAAVQERQWRKELLGARGNDPEFCLWAARALGIAAPGKQPRPSH